MHGEHVANQAPPLHLRDVAVVPVALNHDFFITADVVCLAEVSASLFGVSGEGGAADCEVCRGLPLAGELRVGWRVIRDDGSAGVNDGGCR